MSATEGSRAAADTKKMQARARSAPRDRPAVFLRPRRPATRPPSTDGLVGRCNKKRHEKRRPRMVRRHREHHQGEQRGRPPARGPHIRGPHRDCTNERVHKNRRMVEAERRKRACRCRRRLQRLPSADSPSLWRHRRPRTARRANRTSRRSSGCSKEMRAWSARAPPASGQEAASAGPCRRYRQSRGAAEIRLVEAHLSTCVPYYRKKAPMHGAFKSGRYWARTSDPQLVDPIAPLVVCCD